MKPTNKAEQRSAAEPVERRAEAEGNAGQQSTRRRPSASVSQALARIRPARMPWIPEVGTVCGKAARTDCAGGAR